MGRGDEFEVEVGCLMGLGILDMAGGDTMR